MDQEFVEVASRLAQIRDTSSKLTKEALLSKYSEDELLVEVLRFIYDPYFTTGIGSRKLINGFRAVTGGVPMHARTMMKYLREHNTGDSQTVKVALMFIGQFNTANIVAQWLAAALVTKDLQIGVSVTTLNSIFGRDFIPTVGIMRGMPCPDNAQGLYLLTEKIDGNRRLIMNKVTGVEIYTRSGKRDNGLVEIEEQARELPMGYVYDSECVAAGDFSDALELRQASASILNSGGLRKGVNALCFDMLLQSEYDYGMSTWPAWFRKFVLARVTGDDDSMLMIVEHNKNVKDREQMTKAMNYFGICKLPNIRSLPILGFVHNKKEALALTQPIWDGGGEGTMMVEYNSKYEVNPNPRSTLLKIKQTQESVLKCIDVVEGDGKYIGMLGAIMVEYKWIDGPNDIFVHTAVVSVGSGFTDYMRELYWNNPSLIIGEKVEIEHFGESRNQQGGHSLNCPRFKRIAGAKE